MKIRAKLSVTFILLLIFGVTAVSSYAIMFIRNFLLEEGLRTIEQHAEWMALSISALDDDVRFRQSIASLANISGYNIGLYTADGDLFLEYSDDPEFTSEIITDRKTFESEAAETRIFNNRNWKSIYVIAKTSGDRNPAGWIRVSQKKETIYKPITTIRWIIYTGMFISVGLILIVSDLFSRYLSKPILQLTESASRIANGEVEHQVELPRSDEFGTLANSINRMASRLRRDIEQIQEYSHKQNRLFADIAHEIRNPLHTIMGSMEMLEMEELDSDKKLRHLKNARSQAERMNRLFHDLLTLQRFDSDPEFVNIKPFDLNEVLSRLEDLYRDNAVKKNLEFKLDSGSSGKSVQVLGDEGKIEQVLDNLISNAIKYTSKGSVEVKCQLTDEFVQIGIIDTGIGIEEHHIPNLFDRFYRTDKARSRDSGGTGLGLAVVKGILDAHGSEIQVSSRVNTGTTFEFRLSRIS